MIVVKSSGSAEPALDHVAVAFEAKTGRQVQVAYSAAIEDYDVLVASADAVERKFRPAGKVAGAAVSLGSMALGVAVRLGAPLPDVSTVPALVAALRASDRILLTENHTSGLYIERLLRDMGLAEEMTPRIEHCANGPRLMERVLAGQGAEIGFLSINAIRTFADRGLVLAGALPEEVQLVREFVAIPATGSRDPATARAFADFCGGIGRPILATHGFG